MRVIRGNQKGSSARKHRYGKNPAVPVPGTSWVRILPGYCCMRTPGVPVFGKKKKNFPVWFWYRLGRVKYGSGTGRGKTEPKQRHFKVNLIPIYLLQSILSHSFSSATPLSLSSLLSIPPPPVHSVLSFSFPHSTGDGLRRWIILDLRATALDHLGSEGDLRATASF